MIVSREFLIAVGIVGAVVAVLLAALFHWLRLYKATTPEGQYQLLVARAAALTAAVLGIVFSVAAAFA